MTKPVITPKQQEVLDLVDDVGQNPKLIAERMGITRNGVSVHLRKLRELGVLPAKGKRRGPKPHRQQKRTPAVSSNGHMPDAASEIHSRVQEVRDGHLTRLGTASMEVEHALAYHREQKEYHAREIEVLEEVAKSIEAQSAAAAV